ncbi:MAG: AMP-binding protein [Panacagrimonas sp.]
MTPKRLPLIAPDEPLRTVAWRGLRSVSQQEFLNDVRALAARLPDATHALNLCEDRYRFMTAFAAVCLRGQTNLLPPSQSSGVIAEIAGAYPGCYALGETAYPDLPLRWIAVNDAEASPDPAPQTVPLLPEDQVAALVFTSGSTGAPQAHAKTWRTLVQTARLSVQRFMPDGYEAGLVATVPSQHMYGLETTVMMALAGGCAAHSARAFFPADVRQALQQVPAPRVLITTPVHLRACLAATLSLPRLHLVISATAPLDPELAAAAEIALGAPVQEIYGCTEAGSMASRRLVDSPIWRFFPGMSLSRQDGADIVDGPNLTAPVVLPDEVEDLGEGQFRLRGRSADMLKLAGKRGSLSELTGRLLRIPGVSDAVVFVPESLADGEVRPAALVVAPQLSESQILAALALVIDPVFLPRPLIRLSRLPRNAVGKLPRAALLAELERSRA